MRTFLTTVLLLGAALSPGSHAAASVEQIIDEEMPASGVPGLAYAIVDGDTQGWTKYGLSSPRDRQSRCRRRFPLRPLRRILGSRHPLLRPRRPSPRCRPRPPLGWHLKHREGRNP